MAVTQQKIDILIKETKRFLVIAKKAQSRLNQDRYASFGCKETGAVRRASMDLSRCLVEIRK